mmetsp:Transcript_65933/g.213355  ORF Transcript_65933/g.213355 Transcript_65933/m.213355 type:complete len:167 (-) Transcript_65933:307-807(-)
MAAETCTGRNWEALVLVPTSPNDVGIVQKWRPLLNRGSWPGKGIGKGKGLASVWRKAWVPPPCEQPIRLDTGGEDVSLTVAFCMAASETSSGWASSRRMACSGGADLAWLLRHLGMTDARWLLRLMRTWARASVKGAQAQVELAECPVLEARPLISSWTVHSSIRP